MIDVYICDYIRTPIGRYGGALSSVRADDLGAVPLKALIERNPSLDPAAIDEVIFGCANQAGEDNRNVARMSLLLAGYPETVPGTTMNRLCGSGMDAVITAARAIKAGEAEVIVAGGVESMSRAPFVMPKAETAFARNNEVFDTTIGWRFVNKMMKAQYGVDSMPETAENVAEDFNINRADQDAFALRSQQRAGAAMSSGRLAQEIVPVSIPQRRGDPILVSEDEHPRPSTTLEALQKLESFVKADGTVTAGNASGVNDGAAALILATKEAAEKQGLTPIAKVLGGATAGVAPRIMGFGPAPASKMLMARLGLRQEDFSVIELNEAFASQGLATLRDLGIADDDSRVNPNGGAISLGHPLGMSGARITGTAMLELEPGEKSFSTMCIGVGQGIAIALEAV
ncbi:MULTISPECIES: 3-oxoadipyl-CoA thiolase [unclassified Sulfitobacter]|uniref:3-oxoadipyl-CoA thiolase n=1 Tax=unclassified Sulfitobacter TaxID=196795 RepID=UPI0004E360BE|nr:MULTISPECIES: 3-oxoadipyl-CoA thiolase [unclassified Sulfitobacter]PTB00467.1 3-oxoadipyl-CoA thiolase [Sulfitobacter sp. CB-A]ULO20287.1 3-oxoadipyl-CoA thiolase [Sulfitobacter sp. CB2047]